MIHLAITAVELSNHGPLRGTQRFELPGCGLSVYVRPNESGKTTLLESVAGILWGETATSKNWSSASQEPHCGTVEFLRSELDDRRRLRVQRDFQTNEVIAWELDADGRRDELFRGVHNPAGRTADQRRWPDRELPKLWTPISCDAFRHLAMLTQPLSRPEHLEGNLVQRLITGSGTSTAEDAQEALVERFRSLSKLSREAGISRVNGRKSGRLDELLAQRDRLQSELSQATGDLERAEGLRGQLDQLHQQEEALHQQQENLKRSLELIRHCRELKRDLDGAVQRAGELENAARQARKADQEIATADGQIGQLPEGFQRVDPEELSELKRRLDEYRVGRASLETPEQAAERRAELRKEYDDVWDWPDDAADRIGPLQQASEGREAAQAEVERCRDQLDRVQPQPDTVRRCVVAVAVGAALALAAAFLFASFHGFLIGVTIGALAGIAVAATTHALYHPQREHPDYWRFTEAFDAAQRESSDAERAVESARANVAWAGDASLTHLAQLAERHNALRRRLDQLQQQQRRQSRLRAELDPADLPDPLPQLIESAQGNADKVTRQLDEFRAGENRRRQAEAAINAALGTLGCRDRDELDGRLQEWQDRRVGARRALDLLAKENALAEELQQMQGAQIETRQRDLQQQSEEIRKRLEDIQQRTRGVRRELDAIELGVKINVADAENRLSQAEAEIGRLTNRCEAIKQAHELISQAARRYSAHHREAIEGRINDLMAAWTGRSDRRFTVAEDFSLGLTLETAGQGGRVELAVLSEGAQDQLALAARMAVLDRIGVDVVLPILIDDALLTWDHERRARLFDALTSAAGHRQIILVSHDPAFQNWGEPISAQENKMGSEKAPG